MKEKSKKEQFFSDLKNFSITFNVHKEIEKEKNHLRQNKKKTSVTQISLKK